MSDVFISYSSLDREAAQRFAQALEDSGVSVWWDRDIPAGRDYQEVIEEQISLARCVLVLWTRESVQSRWVRTEASDAHEREIMLPVLLDRVPIPFAFRLIQAEDFTAWDGRTDTEPFQRLMLQVSEMVRRGPRRRADAPAAGSPAAATPRIQPTRFRSPPPGGIATIAVLAAMWIAAVYTQTFKGPLAVAVGAAIAVLLLFSLAEGDISPRMRSLAQQWLLPRQGAPRVRTAEAFNNLFEAVFGYDHFSAFCFVRAALTSIASLALVLVLVRTMYGASVEFTAGIWISLVIFGGSVNVLGDYLCLYKTRLLLRAYRKGAPIYLLAPLDLPVTLGIFVGTIGLALVVIYALAVSNGQIQTGGEGFVSLVGRELALLLKQPYLDLFDPASPDLMQLGRRRLLYASAATTFLTSIWLWAALILTPPVRTLIWMAGAGVSLIGSIFDAAGAPFRALGYLCATGILSLGAIVWGGGQVYAAWVQWV
jgi:hypothetical protein